MVSQAMVAIGSVSPSVTQIELVVTGATIRIVHEDREDIRVNANNVKNWKVANGKVEQVGSTSGGVDVVINQVSSAGVCISGGRISVGRGGSVSNMSINGQNITIKNDEIWVNGKRVDGGATGDSDAAPDELLVLVPKSYRGGLRLSYENGSTVVIDGWQGGDVSIDSQGGGMLKAGDFSDLTSLDLLSFGGGDFHFGRVGARTFMANKTGSADLRIRELNVDSLMLTQVGSGDTKVSSGSARSGGVNSTGSGDVYMRGGFGSIRKRGVGSGDIEIDVID